MISLLYKIRANRLVSDDNEVGVYGSLLILLQSPPYRVSITDKIVCFEIFSQWYIGGGYIRVNIHINLKYSNTNYCKFKYYLSQF